MSRWARDRAGHHDQPDRADPQAHRTAPFAIDRHPPGPGADARPCLRRCLGAPLERFAASRRGGRGVPARSAKPGFAVASLERDDCDDRDAVRSGCPARSRAGGAALAGRAGAGARRRGAAAAGRGLGRRPAADFCAGVPDPRSAALPRPLATPPRSMARLRAAEVRLAAAPPLPGRPRAHPRASRRAGLAARDGIKHVAVSTGCCRRGRRRRRC